MTWMEGGGGVESVPTFSSLGGRRYNKNAQTQSLSDRILVLLHHLLLLAKENGKICEERTESWEGGITRDLSAYRVYFIEGKRGRMNREVWDLPDKNSAVWVDLKRITVSLFFYLINKCFYSETMKGEEHNDYTYLLLLFHPRPFKQKELTSDDT